MYQGRLSTLHPPTQHQATPLMPGLHVCGQIETVSCVWHRQSLAYSTHPMSPFFRGRNRQREVKQVAQVA